MAVTNIYITRHGQTEWNVQGRLQGHHDSPLTEMGIKHAERLANSLAGNCFDVIYSSPSYRTLQTAEIIRGQRSIDIKKDENLREINMGSWEGMKIAEIKRQFPQEHETFWTAPEKYISNNNGETYQEVYNRATEFVKKIITSNIAKSILVVTHTVTLKCLMSYFEGRPLNQLWDPPFIHPTSLSHVMINDGKITIKKHGDMTHIDGNSEGVQ